MVETPWQILDPGAHTDWAEMNKSTRYMQGRQRVWPRWDFGGLVSAPAVRSDHQMRLFAGDV